MMRRAFVHLGYGFGAEQYREKYRKGLVPDLTPYGIHHAESMGWDVQYSVDYPENNVLRFVRRALNSVLGFDGIHAWRNRKALAQADIVWTMEERQGLAVLCLGFVLRMPPAILQIVWLFDQWKGFGALRRAYLHRLLQRASRITVHSSRYLDYVKQLDLRVEPVLLPFGISSDSFASATLHPAHTPIHVLAMGSDATRDWKTFLDAFAGDPRFSVVAISPHLSAESLADTANVTVPVKPSMKEFRDFYTWADVVVIPMVPNLYSGITVALEAARCGVPVVSSRTGGVPTYLNDGEAIYVDPLDAAALREAVLHLDEERRAEVTQRALSRFQTEDYTTRGLAARYIHLSEQILCERETRRISRTAKSAVQTT